MDERSHRRLNAFVGGWTPAELSKMATIAVRGADKAVDSDAATHAADTGADPGYYAIVGSHAYGFTTADSDIDVRGFHVADGRRYALLDQPRARVQVPATTPREIGPAPVDFESLELRAFAEALAGEDFTLVEAVLAAPVVRDDVPAAVDSLRDLLRDHLPLGLPSRYVGMARSLRAELDVDPSDGSGPDGDPKTALYALRALYAAAYVAKHGDVVTDVFDLARAVDGDPELVEELVAARRAGGWPEPSVNSRSSLYERTLTTIDRWLDAASDGEPTAAEREDFRTALDEWLCETRGWTTLAGSGTE